MAGLERRLREPSRLGFGRAIVPRPRGGTPMPVVPGMAVVAVGTLREAITESLE